MMRLAELVRQATVPLIVSAAIGGYNILQRAEYSESLLRQNIEVTAELSRAVTDLRLQMATFSEKYVTRDELERKIGHTYGPRDSKHNQSTGRE